MPLDVWFPLAIHYADLADAADHNPLLRARIEQLHNAAGARRTLPTTSWTGDVHDVDRLHFDPAFDWLTDQVGLHALDYLKTIGHDLAKTDIYIQRSWPVIATRDQGVSRHAHHTAHLSAVYYVAVAEGDAGGKTRFYNDARPNELSAGIGSDMTKGYAQTNALNFASADYTPIAGRLLLFPAKQTHSVEPHHSDDPRISISYDIVLTARDEPGHGHHEFLMPAPSVWKRIARSDATMLAPVAVAPLGDGRTPLADVARMSRPIDSFTIPERAGHIMWETLVLPHIVSPAAWHAYASELADVDDAGWLHDASGSMWLWHGCGSWGAWRDAVDRLYVQMEQDGVALAAANLTAPVLQRRTGDGAPPHRRGKAHLSLYLRIDHGAGDCSIDFAEGGTVDLPSGALALVSGFRRHRLTGTSHIVHFELDLPALARPDALVLRAFQGSDVQDDVVFSALTAQPPSDPLPPSPVLFEKIRWLDARARRRHRHRDCLAVRRYLVDNADPDTASSADLDLVRSHGVGTPDHPGFDGRLIELEQLLDAGQCEALRAYADAHMTAVVPDSVDEWPEYQTNISIDQLADLIGCAATDALLQAPSQLGARVTADPRTAFAEIHIFLRVFSPDTRSYIAFHSDTCDYTVNVALSDDAAVDGGRLLALDGDRLRAIDRMTGSAVLHTGNLIHGVTRIARGTRHSLILFMTAMQQAATT